MNTLSDHIDWNILDENGKLTLDLPINSIHYHIETLVSEKTGKRIASSDDLICAWGDLEEFYAWRDVEAKHASNQNRAFLAGMIHVLKGQWKAEAKSNGISKEEIEKQIKEFDINLTIQSLLKCK